MKPIAAVTGANSGIGKEITRALIASGHHVLMLCRNSERAKKTQNQLHQEVGLSSSEILLVDLASLHDIVRVAEEIKSKYPALNILINNAGLYTSSYSETPDGHELTIAVNHLAVQLLTDRLHPLLAAAAAADAPSRVVNVASEAHRRGKIHFNDIHLRTSFSGMAAYSQSKLANILHARAMAPHLIKDNILINSCHPGVVATNFASGESGLMGSLFKMFKWAMISPEKGAETPLFLALEDLPEPNTGRYYDKCRPRKPTSNGRDSAQADDLISLSREIINSTIGAQGV